MKTAEILNQPKEEVISKWIDELNEFASYKNGLRNAKEQAEKNYAHAIKMHTWQRRWWKVVETLDKNHLLWTKQSRETVLVKKDGTVVFEDELVDSYSADKLARNLKAKLYFLGTREEIITKIKNNDFEGTGLIPPLDML